MSSARTNQLDARSLTYMALLALQFGIQPILTRRFTSPEAARSTVVVAQELVKFVMALFMLRVTDGYSTALKNWTPQSWLFVALVPAALYSIQNLASLTAYQNLDALTYNVVNQTKTLSAALCCYFVMGRKQSKVQILSLFLLLLSALVMEGIVNVKDIFHHSSSSQPLYEMSAQRFTHGVAPLLLASFISGLAGALSQKNLQAAGGGRNPYLFSMELCAASLLLLLGSLAISPDGQAIAKRGVWHGWTPSTFVPIVTNSAGGLLVGLVTKHAGSVRKGFALIFGIFLSGIIQAILQPESSIETCHIVGGILAAISLYLHASFPPVIKTKAD